MTIANPSGRAARGPERGFAPDLLVVGAGIFGLSVAWAALKRGLSVAVLEAETPGAGASGGIVGALSPHVPEQWNPKKQFQLDALLSAGTHWAEVAAISGVDPGYARTGRLMPLSDAEARERAADRARGAAVHWGGAAEWRLRDDADPGWLAGAACGAVHETLSARIFPRAAVRALAAAVEARGGRIRSGCAVRAVAGGRVETDMGPVIAGRIVIAAGVPGFGLMAPALGQVAGQGVKGQAALLRADVPPDAPMLYHDGLYVVPHGNGLVAVGSTSENRWDEARATDGLLDDVLVRARALCPALEGAEVVERWAGLRPKARRRDPMLGEIPGLAGVYSANGAFKIGFGIAHHAGALVARMVTGEAVDLPESFTVAHHLSRGLRA
ncbi:NAD(P)/FAD-dependent oxidoreductase [Halovulum dunhuangense]|uniref:NAD(P)/FAD-dependent oxidoreductase n=1 Tax=Halovulum dunhuangense TaxID=1505036 RepID=UPI001FE5FA14|nr:FAD-binding oxidoreductase [Halovulum dunhuangense]